MVRSHQTVYRFVGNSKGTHRMSEDILELF